MHNIYYEIYKDSVVKTEASRKKIQIKWDEIAARENGKEGCNGLLDSIKWREDIEPYKSVEEAQKAIEAFSNRIPYYQCAMRFTKVERNATLERMEKRLADLEAEIKREKDTPYYSPDTVKSKYITCKHCGSKLSVEYLSQNNCPLCHEDLRPATIQTRSKKKVDNLKKLTKEVEKYRDSHKAVYWLVKVEYHT